MNQQVRKHRFNVDVAATVIWVMFAAVVCYAIGVWLAVAVVEHDHSFAVFFGGVYRLAAVLSVVIASTIVLAVAMVLRIADRKSRFSLPSAPRRA